MTGANCKCFFLFTFSFKFFGINPSKNFSYEYTKTSSLSLVGLVTFSDRVVRRRKTKGRIPLQTCFATVLPSFFRKQKEDLHYILYTQSFPLTFQLIQSNKKRFSFQNNTSYILVFYLLFWKKGKEVKWGANCKLDCKPISLV